MRRCLQLLVALAACGCAGRSASGDSEGDGTTGDESAADTISPGTEGDEAESGTTTVAADMMPDETGPYLEGLPSACVHPPDGPLYAESIASSHEAVAGFAASRQGAAAATSLQDDAWWLTVLCPDGSLAWRVQLPVDGQAFVSAVAFAPDGDVWISGGTFVNQSYERMVGRYSADGELRWLTEFPGTAYPDIQLAYSPLLGVTQLALDGDWGPAGFAELALDIEVSDAGRVFVTGDIDDALLGNDTWTAEILDVLGVGGIAWERRTQLPDMCETGFALDFDGQGFVTVSTRAESCGAGFEHQLVVRRHGFGADVEWETSVPAGPNLRMWYVDARDGVTVVSGSGVGPDDQPRARLLRFDAQGALSWELVDDGDAMSWGSGVKLDADGRIAVVGTDGPSPYSPWLHVHDAGGNLVDSQDLDGLCALEQDGDGDLYVLHHFPNETGLDGFVVEEIVL